MRTRTLVFEVCLFVFVIISAVLSLQLTAAAQICNSGVCITTWQQDTGVPDVAAGGVYRTGQNLLESKINPSTLNNVGVFAL